VNGGRVQGRGRGRPSGKATHGRGAEDEDHPAPAWTAQVTLETPKRFTGPSPGPAVNCSSLDVLQTFQLIFTEQFLQKIVDFTNENYNRKKQVEPAKNKMEMEPLTVDELKSWLGLIMGMGLLQLKGNIRKYWTKQHKLTRVPGFAEVFPVTRFLLILRYIHFVDEASAITDRNNHNYDRFYKVRYLLDYLVPKWRELYSPSEHLSIDESMIKGQGRMPARQFLRNKPHRWGIKNWALAESETGYVLNCELYCGKVLTEMVITIPPLKW